MAELSKLQKEYLEAFGTLNCPICKVKIVWDLHTGAPELDWGICDNEKCDVLIVDTGDIEELKNRMQKKGEAK